MIKKSVTAEEVVELLNEIVKLDPEAANKLVNIRVDCNEALAEHPTIQVMNSVNKDNYVVGALGVINGLFGIDEDGYGCIAAEGELNKGNVFVVSGFKLVAEDEEIRDETQ